MVYIHMAFVGQYRWNKFTLTLIAVAYFFDIDAVLINRKTTDDKKNEICFDLVGCFSLDYPWRSIWRPFPQPWSPNDINVTLYLITRNSPEMDHAIKPLEDLETEVNKIDFCSERRATVFIVHGFFASGQSPWMKQMADAYLFRRDANVFIVNWADGANHANYLQVASNIRVVAAIVARFLTYLIDKKNLDPCRLHLIGHSLGAHICSYIGKRVPGIERITALDAAQIGFEGGPSEIRLDPDDAVFIDCHHTNAKPTIPFFGLGFMRKIGDVDFYLNGGLTQPNCFTPYFNTSLFSSPLQIAMLPVDLIGTYLACSHSKSTEYFIEAINRTDCIFWGHKGNLLANTLNVVTMGRLSKLFYKLGKKCDLEICTPMGLETFAYPARGSFSVGTNLYEPYCYPNDILNQEMESALYNYYTGEQKLLTTSEDYN